MAQIYWSQSTLEMISTLVRTNVVEMYGMMKRLEGDVGARRWPRKTGSYATFKRFNDSQIQTYSKLALSNCIL